MSDNNVVTYENDKCVGETENLIQSLWMGQNRNPSLLSDFQPSRRGFLAIIACAAAAGRLDEKRLLGQPRPKMLAEVSQTPAPVLPTHNPRLNLGFDLTHQKLRLYYASLDGKQIEVDDPRIQNWQVITASTIKAFSTLLVVDGCTGRFNAYSDYAAAHPQHSMDVFPATRPLMSFDDVITISRTSSRLNSSRRAIAGQKMTVMDALKIICVHSDNGVMETLSCYYGQKLIDAKLAPDDGNPVLITEHSCISPIMKRNTAMDCQAIASWSTLTACRPTKRL